MSDLNLYNGSGGRLPDAVTYSEQNRTSSEQERARQNIDAEQSGASPTPSGGAVRYDEYQTLTDAQKETARNNIGASAGGESPVPAPKAAYAAELADTISKVKELQKFEPTLAWIRYTDAHYGYNTSYAAQKYILDDAIPVFNELSKNLKLEFIVDTGDITNGTSSNIQSYVVNDYIYSRISQIGLPIMMTPGNHDVGSSSRYLDLREHWEYYCRRADNRANLNLEYPNNPGWAAQNKYSRNGTDSYIDYDSVKLRMVFINGNGVNGDSMDFRNVNQWLLGLINSLPNHWDMIIFSHVPTFPSQCRIGDTPIGTAHPYSNIDLVESQGTDRHYVATIYGHTHFDATFAYPHFGVNTTCEKYITGVGYPSYGFVSYGTEGRVAGQASEHAIDVMVYRPVSKALHVIRFGAGVDRTIHYIPQTVAVGSTITITPDHEAVSWELWQYIEDSASEHDKHYRSDSVTYASIADGVVTGLSAGTVGVRCYDADGNYEMWRVVVTGE